MGCQSDPLPKQRDIQKAAGYPNGLPKHSPLGLYSRSDPRTLHCHVPFTLEVPAHRVQDFIRYAQDQLAHNPEVPLASRELIWGLSQSTCRKIDVVRHDMSQDTDWDTWDDPDDPRGSEKLTQEEIDAEFGDTHEPYVVEVRRGELRSLKSYFTLEELRLAAPYLPPYVTINGLKGNWETRAKYLQAACDAKEADDYVALLAQFLVDEDYRHHVPLVDDTPEPLEVEMPEQAREIAPELQLLAQVKQAAPMFEGFHVLKTVGSYYEETVRPSRLRRLRWWLMERGWYPLKFWPFNR